MPVKLTRRHGSPYWYIRGSIRGVRVDESTGLRDEGAAGEVLIKRAAEIQERSIHGDAVSRTFSEAALSYMQAGGECEHLPPLLKLYGARRLITIGQHDFDEAARKLCAGQAGSTANRQVFTPMAAVLHHAARKKWCAKPVIERPAQPKGRVRWITHEEAERLIEAASEHIRPLVIFLLCTGARISEALYLDWRDVDLSRAHVAFCPTELRGIKNDEARGVPLHPRAVAALANLPWDRQGAVFRRPGRPGRRERRWEPYTRRKGGGGMISTAWDGMCKRAGISDFTPHDCRHTWATWHYRANRDLTALMELGGWKSVDMVIRYAHVNASHLAPSIMGLWGIDGERPSGDQLIALKAKAE